MENSSIHESIHARVMPLEPFMLVAPDSIGWLSLDIRAIQAIELLFTLQKVMASIQYFSK